MIDRRDFLGGILALTGGPALGTVDTADRREYLADLARCDARVLGIPSRRALLADGFHPVTPERVIVVDNDRLDRFRRRHRGLRRQFREKETRLRARCHQEPMPPDKLEVVVGLMDLLTTHYRRPDLFEKWSRALFLRETLGSTGIGYGLGLLHDFQAMDTPVRTANGIVDWWLALLPNGVEWHALDDRPVHFMVGPVMERRQPGTYLRVMEAMSRGMRPLVAAEDFDPAAWSARLSRMDPADAAREFNVTIAKGLGGPDRRHTRSRRG